MNACWGQVLGAILIGLPILSAPAQTTFIPTGSLWKYFAAGSAQSNAWRTVHFDDSSWSSGPAQLGYGDADESTIVADAASAPLTIYLRHSFVITNRPPLFTLTLRLLRNDGVVVYLNSNEVYRSNLPEGFINHLTPAIAAVDGDDEGVFHQRAAPPYLLTAGTNVLAVELHQHPDGRADESFDLTLLGNIPNTPPGVTMTSPEDGAIYDPGNIPISATAEDADGHVYLMNFHAGINLFHAETNIVGSVRSPPFNFVWSNVPRGRYLVGVVAYDNSGRSARSPWAHVQVGDVAGTPLERGPYLQSGTSTGMVVRWRTGWFADSRVRYGSNPANLDLAAHKSHFAIDHEVQINRLLPDTKYYYSIGHTDGVLAGGRSTFSEPHRLLRDPFECGSSVIRVRPDARHLPLR